jgi:hypothetical protein
MATTIDPDPAQPKLPSYLLASEKIPPHLALRERNKQIQKLVQLLTWWSKSDQKKSAQHLTIVVVLLYSSSGRVPFVEGILDAKIFFAAPPRQLRLAVLTKQGCEECTRDL